MKILRQGKGQHPSYNRATEALETNRHFWICLTCHRYEEFLFVEKACELASHHKRQHEEHDVRVNKHKRIARSRRQWRIVRKP